MRAWLVVYLAHCALAAEPELEWKLYLASVAAADGALRRHETSEANRWLAEAPPAHRGWEWRYLKALSGQSSFEKKAHNAAITGVASDTKGQWLATTSGDKTVRIWDARTGELVTTLEGHTAATWSPAFRPGRNELATMGSDGTVRVWSITEKKEIRRYENLGNGLGAVAWSADGSLLGAAAWKLEKGRGVIGMLHLWDFEKNELRWKSEYGVKPISSIAFGPDGRQLAAGTWDGWVGFFAVDGDGKPAFEAKYPQLEGTYPAMQAVAYSPDGQLLASGSKDGMIRWFDASNGKLHRETLAHGRWVNSLSFDRAGRWLASGSSDETLRLWDAVTGRPVRVLHGHTASINGMTVVGDRIVTGAADGTLRWWSTGWSDVSKDTWSHPKDVYGFDFAKDGSKALSASWGGTLKLWNTHTGKELWEKPVHEQSANAVVFSPDGTRFVSGGNDGRLQLGDATNGSVLATWEKIADGRAAGIAWSGDGKTVFCPSSRPSGKLWDAQSGKVLHTVTGGKGEIYDAAFSPDSRWVAVGWTSGYAKVVDRESGADVLVLPQSEGGVFAVAFHPSGKILATGGADRKVRLWELPGGRLIKTMEGHSELIYALDYSPDGSRLASGSTDMTARLWAENGDPVLTIPFPVQVYAVKFSPEGKRLAVVPMNGTIRILSAP